MHCLGKNKTLQIAKETLERIWNVLFASKLNPMILSASRDSPFYSILENSSFFDLKNYSDVC